MSSQELTRRSFLGLTGAAVAGLAGCSAGQQDSPAGDTAHEQAEEDASPTQADLLITNALVHTMRAEDDTAEAVVIAGNEIMFVGSAADAEQYASNATRRIDLGGCLVVPGFMDGHMHVLDGAVDGALTCDLTNYITNDDYLEALRAFVEAYPEREVYFGTNFEFTVYQQDDGTNPGPRKEDLDSVCPDKPLMVYDVTRQHAWVNSVALERGSITADTQDPEGGTIYRNEDGTPRGCLSGTAIALVPLEQTYTEGEYLGALKAFCALCNSYGLTGVTNIDAFGEEGMKLLHKLEEAGELTLRVNMAPVCETSADVPTAIKLVEAHQRYASDLLTCKTVKLFADGVTEDGTAWMQEPYAPEAGFGNDWQGEQRWSDEDLRSAVELFDKEGIQVHIHAMGDAAVHQALDAFEAAGSPKRRHTIAHACAVAENDIQRMADQDVLASLQFAWMYRNSLCEIETTYLGEERALGFFPTRSLWDAGVRICGGSDGPSSEFRVLEGFEVGVTRNDPYEGEEELDLYRWPEQGLTPYELLQAYTTNVAYQNFCEDMVGSIEVGKKADLVCLDTNILSDDPKTIGEARVLFTISDGRVVFEG